jgi:hypothetical protein
VAIPDSRPQRNSSGVGVLPGTLAQLLGDEKTAGQAIRVGVIDTGIDRGALERRFDRLVSIEGAIFAPDQAGPLPYQGRQSAPHGTSVAGILLRYAPRITLVSADVFGNHGKCDAELLMKAIVWCAQQAGCQVINMSLGITRERLLPVQRRWQLQRIIEDCYHRNVVAIAAAHNEHPLSKSFPAVLGAPLIGVQKGPWHDDLVVRYQPEERVEFQATGSSEGDLLTMTPATSWAAAHMSALVARLLSAQPELTPFQVKTLLHQLGATRPEEPGCGLEAPAGFRVAAT